jgi:hypothetical protein
MIKNFTGIYLQPTAHLGGGGLEEKYNYLVEVETKHSGIT